jgi:integrase
MNESAKTLYVSLSDAEIRRQAAGQARTLRDKRYPQLRFRFSTVDRGAGAWHVVVRDRWSKAGDYPGINCKAMVAALPEILLRLGMDTQAKATTTPWVQTGELLAWYQDRMLRDRGLSAKRKAGAKSALNCHLAPRLGDLPLVDLGKASLDSLLMWPLQERYQLSYVRLVYNVLAKALRQAYRLGLLHSNPMTGLKFTDFVSTRIRPKAARLRSDDVPALLARLAAGFEERTADTLLALMMLCHGTRLGETRTALWRHINLATGVWFIPAADTKTKVEHTLPLTAQACALLEQYRARQLARGYSGGYLFPGIKRGAMTATTATAVFRSHSDGQWSSHDLRKVARTCWMDLGIDYLVGEMLVNHALKNMDATYIHTHAETQKRQALERWHQRLDEQGLSVFLTGTYPGHKISSKSPKGLKDVGCSVNQIPPQRSMEIPLGGGQ